MIRNLGLAGVALALVAGPPARAAEEQKAGRPAAAAAAQGPFTFREVMIPMRDGVRLQTVILTPTDHKEPLPILLQRTPYGVPDRAPTAIPPVRADLIKDGYILVFQNLRGRFKSEGEFQISTRVDLRDPKAVNEVTDAYDTIDWLVKNQPRNNGRVGIMGVSYGGLTAGLTLLAPHPALKAVSDQAAPADLFLNDDMHHFGALRLSYVFEYAALVQSEKMANAPFRFDTYDTYDWYLKLGPLSNAAKRLNGAPQSWRDVVDHPNYDAYWKSQAWADQIRGARVPTLTVAGFWDQEDPWGPWRIYRQAEQHDPNNLNLIVAGPWTHGGWLKPKADHLGSIDLGGHDTAAEFRADIEAPFFRYWLHGKGERPTWGARIFQTGSNTWRDYAAWPPQNVRSTRLYLHSDGSLSFAPPQGGGPGYREYVSDPANPVPYRPRPIGPTFTSAGWTTWETNDQRFVDHRPDVLSYVSAPLEDDLVVTGPVSATLTASTSGTDSDFVVKLIDVFPEDAEPMSQALVTTDGPAAASLNGYQLPIAMEVRRGRYLKDFSQPTALTPDSPTQWDVPLRDRDHVFRKGHRIMVQIQSSWFPLIDRNPQQFTPSIYGASQRDFVKATQRIYDSPDHPSYVTLPLAPASAEVAAPPARR